MEKHKISEKEMITNIYTAEPGAQHKKMQKTFDAYRKKENENIRFLNEASKK